MKSFVLCLLALTVASVARRIEPIEEGERWLAYANGGPRKTESMPHKAAFVTHAGQLAQWKTRSSNVERQDGNVISPNLYSFSHSYQAGPARYFEIRSNGAGAERVLNPFSRHPNVILEEESGESSEEPFQLERSYGGRNIQVVADGQDARRAYQLLFGTSPVAESRDISYSRFSDSRPSYVFHPSRLEQKTHVIRHQHQRPKYVFVGESNQEGLGNSPPEEELQFEHHRVPSANHEHQRHRVYTLEGNHDDHTSSVDFEGGLGTEQVFVDNNAIESAESKSEESDENESKESDESESEESDESESKESDESESEESDESKSKESDESKSDESESKESDESKSKESDESKSKESDESKSDESKSKESDESKSKESDESKSDESDESKSKESDESKSDESKSKESDESKSKESDESKSDESDESKSKESDESKSDESKSKESDESKSDESDESKSDESDESKSDESDESKSDESDESKSKESDESKSDESKTKESDENDGKNENNEGKKGLLLLGAGESEGQNDELQLGVEEPMDEWKKGGLQLGAEEPIEEVSTSFQRQLYRGHLGKKIDPNALGNEDELMPPAPFTEPLNFMRHPLYDNEKVLDLNLLGRRPKFGGGFVRNRSPSAH